MATTKPPQPPTSIALLQSGLSIDTMDCHSNPVIAPNNDFSVKKFFKLMKYERLRLITYLLYNHKWPKEDIVAPSELAKAGFFYLHDDSVQCTFCRGIVSGWSYGDEAMEEHKRHFPQCPFVLGENCGNMPLEIDPDVNSDKSKQYKSAKPIEGPEEQSGPVLATYNKTDQPRFPLFSEPLNRSKTFKHPHWKSQLDCNLLIDAGFFYTGQSDRTRCFHCGGLLFNWKPNEKPLEEHARFFPECHFMTSSRGQYYIEYVQFKTQIIEMRQKIDSPQWVKNQDIECMRNISYENFLKMKQSANNLGHKLEKKRKAKTDQGSSYQRYLNKFDFLLDCQKLFPFLKSLEIMQPASPTSETSPDSPLESGPSSSSSQQSVNSSVFSLDDNEGSGGSSKSVSSSDEEEDSQKRDKPNPLTCIICCDKQIEIVFVPCGHQMACRKCADKFTNCPICRVKIDNKVRTYFAH